MLSLALEDIFYRMVIPASSTNDGPIYVGKIDSRHRFPDLSHPSQLQGVNFDVLMGNNTVGKKKEEIKIADRTTENPLLFFSRRSSLLDIYDQTKRPDASKTNKVTQSLSKLTDVDIFSPDLQK